MFACLPAWLMKGQSFFFLLFSYVVYKNKLDIPCFVTGIISGLVSITGQCRFKVRDRLRERFYGFQEGYSFIWLKRVCAVEQDTVFRVLSLTKGDFTFKRLEDRDPKPLKSVKVGGTYVWYQQRFFQKI